MMTLDTELTFCIWDGDADERFRHMDMNRIEYNANKLAKECGVTQVPFIEVTRDQQFRYDEVQRLESLITAIASRIGVSIEPSRQWAPGTPLSYIDIERMELSLYSCYVALGGIGERITAGRFRPVVAGTLFASSWTGSPPSITLDVPMAHGDRDVIAYVPHTATIEQRMAEMEARLTLSAVSDRVLRITATGTKPRINIPIRISLGGISMIETKTLGTGWSGSGPWTQDVTLEDEPENVLVGLAEGTTSEQSRAYIEAGIHVSAVNGNTVTIRALFEKPTVSIPVGIMYSTSSVI